VISYERIEFRENSYQQLIKLLKKETKINFEFYQRKFIERRIKARMIRVNCNTIDLYYKYLLSNSDEIKKFVDSFNINYSYFFRNWDVFEQFQKIFLESLNYKGNLIKGNLKPKSSIITTSKKQSQNKKLPRKENYLEEPKNKNIFTSNFGDRTEINHNLIEKSTLYHNNLSLFLSQMSICKKIKDSKTSINPIYILSCPCASGEEPYSIAMILDTLKKQILNFPNYRIVASDIDKEAINKAKIGIYNEDSMKDVSEFYENNYFTKKKEVLGCKYFINEDIKKKVEFIEEDATKTNYKPWKYDIIFCRYLLIYFNRSNRNEFLSTIEKRLTNGGLLILGKTETLFNSYLSFKLIDATNHIYLKGY
jgi:chemotaxis protein methyltransferase CheR